MSKHSLKCTSCCKPPKPSQRINSPNKAMSPSKPGDKGPVFNPQASVYKTCCAHVRTATIVFGIIEIFAICFILVAVLPDMNMTVCKPLLMPPRQPKPELQINPGPNGPVPNQNATTLSPIKPVNENLIASLNWIKSIACDMNVVWLVWAIAQIFSVNLMFYGIKNVLWYLYLPHLLFRCACLLLIGLLCFVIFVRVTLVSQTTGSYILASALSLLIVVLWFYIMICEARCMHFTKRSADTGFSVSQTRTFGPPTTSLSDHAHAAQRRGGEILQKALPPLRHAYGVKRSEAGQQSNARRPSVKSINRERGLP